MELVEVEVVVETLTFIPPVVTIIHHLVDQAAQV
jgi:hypothetical protein